MLIILTLTVLAFNSNASNYQGHPIPDGWNVTFHNESSIEITDGNSTIGMYNVTIPKVVTEWVGTGEDPTIDLNHAVSKKFLDMKGILLDPAPACRTFTTNQVLHPFGADTIRMTFCDSGDYLFTWKTPGIEDDYTCLYSKFRGDYNMTFVDCYRGRNETLPYVLYELLS